MKTMKTTLSSMHGFSRRRRSRGGACLTWEGRNPPVRGVSHLGGACLTWEGAEQDSPPLSSPMRAAAVGLEELMSTGPLISMEWRWGGGASEGLWDMVREVNECLFLVFFFSPAPRGTPGPWAPGDAPSAQSPPGSEGLSSSTRWRPAALNWRRTTGAVSTAPRAGGSPRLAS